MSAATGHQQSNRGGGSSGAATYWEVRTAKMAEQARESVRPPLHVASEWVLLLN